MPILCGIEEEKAHPNTFVPMLHQGIVDAGVVVGCGIYEVVVVSARKVKGLHSNATNFTTCNSSVAQLPLVVE